MQRELGEGLSWLSSLEKSVAIRESLAGDNPGVLKYQEDLAKGYVDLAGALPRDRAADAAAWLGKAVEIRRRLVQDHPTVRRLRQSLAASYTALGTFQRERGQADEAAKAFRQAIEVREHLVRDDSAFAEYLAGLAANYEDLALAQKLGGHGAEGLASRRQAIAIREQLVRDAGELTTLQLVDQVETRQHLAEDSVLMGQYQNQLAASYADLGLLERELARPSKAEAAFGKAAQIRETLNATRTI
jgi:tetratricopeptide (TPR) repeat protein